MKENLLFYLPNFLSHFIFYPFRLNTTEQFSNELIILLRLHSAWIKINLSKLSFSLSINIRVFFTTKLLAYLSGICTQDKLQKPSKLSTITKMKINKLEEK